MNEKKIRKISHFMRVVFQFLTILVPLFMIVMWLTYPWWSVGNLSGYDGMFKEMGISAGPAYKQKLAAMFHDVLPVLVTTIKCYFLTKLFALYERTEIFALEGAKYIRNIGCLFIIQPFVASLNNLLVAYLINIDSLSHHYHITFAIGTDGFGLIITGIVILVFSWIMRLAHEMREENKKIL